MVSIIIPIYNEEKILSKNLPGFRRLAEKAELIFVDGGSSDRSVEVAKVYGKVVRTGKGRALQMNCGAGHAESNILLFLHADNVISPRTVAAVEKRLKNSSCVGGCLTQRIDRKGLIYRILEMQGNLRARATKVFYGDQAIFTKKDKFLKLKGFPEVPIMEDVLFTRKLRRSGRTVVLCNKVSVSPRRWEKKGVLSTILLHNYVTLLHCLKFPLDKIKDLYEDLR
ncbi:MAG: glycosyltransferase family 2 protein [Candidatus Omnitrophica bacterium]|nr:glycosyltransferase family 2 protein [Candidatus Omnitrophota bacterium]